MKETSAKQFFTVTTAIYVAVMCLLMGFNIFHYGHPFGHLDSFMGIVTGLYIGSFLQLDQKLRRKNPPRRKRLPLPKREG